MGMIIGSQWAKRGTRFTGWRSDSPEDAEVHTAADLIEPRLHQTRMSIISRVYINCDEIRDG
jgi:hypothetical protein